MLQYVLNVRQAQLNKAGNALRIYRTNVRKAWRLVGREVLIYAPAGEPDPGYRGVSEILGVHPDLENPNLSWLSSVDSRPSIRP